MKRKSNIGYKNTKAKYKKKTRKNDTSNYHIIFIDNLADITEDLIVDVLNTEITDNVPNDIEINNISRKRCSSKAVWKKYTNIGFNYIITEPLLFTLGPLSLQCNYCMALKWNGEPAGLCCKNGSIHVPDLQQPPEPLRTLIYENGTNSNLFNSKLRKFNNAFQMTSFKSNLISPQDPLQYFKIQGQIQHQIGDLDTNSTDQKKFIQIYFIGDDDDQVNTRWPNANEIERGMVMSLQNMLSIHNEYVRTFKTAMEMNPSNEFGLVIHAGFNITSIHPGRLNLPIANDAGVVVLNEFSGKRDIILNYKNDIMGLKNVDELHRSYDSLQYPILFPYGENGYHLNKDLCNGIDQIVDENRENQRKITSMMFYCYRLQIRSNKSNHIHYFKKLLGQYIVDMYVKIQTERLIYLRNNQSKLRCEQYIDLRDALANDIDPDQLGKMVILPSTFTGGPRYMKEKTMDAMTYVKNYGKPDLFITFTCNAKWPEIKLDTYENTNSSRKYSYLDIPHIVARVFNLKLNRLMDVLIKGELFGRVRCHMYTVEWQKRGLPHAHILLWMCNKIRADEIDCIISAELPSLQLDPELFRIVKSNMIHGPCGTINSNSPCMNYNGCSKRFPKKFVNETQTDGDGYPLYRRRNLENGGNSTELKVKGVLTNIDNRWVVAYSPVLSKMFDAHINVESCQSVKSIRYICKYINKGSDQAIVSIKDRGDEIKTYQTGRYVSASEAAWRIFGFNIHSMAPMIQQLSVHLENNQRVYYSNNNVRQIITNPPNTTLTAFFQLCQQDESARNLCYHEVPKKYRYDGGKWIRRKNGNIIDGEIESDALGRVYTVHPNNFELLCLRTLLHKIQGPTSFQYLLKVDGIYKNSYAEVCKELGLLEDDKLWHITFTEASVTLNAFVLRHFFATIIVHCHVQDSYIIWEKYKESICGDIFNLEKYNAECPNLSQVNMENVYNKGLVLLEDTLIKMGGKILNNYGLPTPDRSTIMRCDDIFDGIDSINMDKVNIFVNDNERKLTDEQRKVYNEIIATINSRDCKLYFLDAPGGTGKTFLINLLLSRCLLEKKKTIPVASSGIAATLLKGGKTAHSAFKLPFNLTSGENHICDIKKGSEKAKLLEECDLIIWDECTMAHKNSIEALDRTLKDIRENNSLMGGVTVLFSGDFRQTLPVIPRGTNADQINACLKSSFLWNNVTKLVLKENLRAKINGDGAHSIFSNILLDIGNGTTNRPNNELIIDNNIGTIVGSLENLILSVYGESRLWHTRTREWWSDKSILATKNDKVKEINDIILSKMTGNVKEYLSIDTTVDINRAVDFPIEFLNSIDVTQLPQHRLKLKVGSIIMLIRNLQDNRLCNGTRLKVLNLRKHYIKAQLLDGDAIFDTVFIPRIPMIYSNDVYELKRIQFPIKLSFAMTINKSQGQTLKIVGVDLRDPVFSHGQLYVAFSRVGSSSNLFILSNKNTKNIVLKMALLDRIL